jgi:hypothetical protein
MALVTFDSLSARRLPANHSRWFSKRNSPLLLILGMLQSLGMPKVMTMLAVCSKQYYSRSNPLLYCWIRNPETAPISPLYRSYSCISDDNNLVNLVNRRLAALLWFTSFKPVE